MNRVRKLIIDWKKNHPNESVIFDEDLNVLEKSNTRTWGSGNYNRVMFKCSKCKKLYSTHGALRYYHKNCREETK